MQVAYGVQRPEPLGSLLDLERWKKAILSLYWCSRRKRSLVVVAVLCRIQVKTVIQGPPCSAKIRLISVAQPVNPVDRIAFFQRNIFFCLKESFVFSSVTRYLFRTTEKLRLSHSNSDHFIHSSPTPSPLTPQ